MRPAPGAWRSTDRVARAARRSASIVPDASISVAYFQRQYEALKRAFAAAR
jgi:hypothetical protein